MAKYITLDNLSRLLSNLKSSNFKASTGNLGAIKIGYNNNSNNGQNYPVRLDGNGKAYIYVPWSNTEISIVANRGVSKSSSNKLTIDLVNSTKSSVSSTDVSAVDVNKFYPIQLDSNNKLSVNVPWEDNAVSSVNNHYLPNNTSQTKSLGLYKITNDNTGHITEATAVTKSDINNLKIYTQTDTGDTIKNIIERVTYSELKTMITNKKLYPGKKYCITDYTVVLPSSITPAGKSVTVTSEGFVFGIIVKAKNTNTLYHDAQACKISNSTHPNFPNIKLNSLKIKYDVNNDTGRFKWANSSNGKGVIYYMKDNNNNEAPYDFLNIKFDEQYTFTYDAHSSIVKPYIKNGEQYLNNISYAGSNCSIMENCCDIIFNGSPYGDNSYNTIGNNCSNITLNGYEVRYNTIGNNCSNITFKDDSNVKIYKNNTIGNNCSNIIFGQRFNENGEFEGSHASNTNICNIIGNNCSNITFGLYNCYNTIGNNCSNITFGFGWEFNEMVDNISDFSIYYKYSLYSSHSDDMKKLRVLSNVSSCIFNKNIKKIFLSDFARYSTYGKDTDFAQMTVSFRGGTYTNVFNTSASSINKNYYNIAGLSGIEFVNLNNTSFIKNDMFELPIVKIYSDSSQSALNGLNILSCSAVIESIQVIITESGGKIKLKLPINAAKNYSDLN